MFHKRPSPLPRVSRTHQYIQCIQTNAVPRYRSPFILPRNGPLRLLLTSTLRPTFRKPLTKTSNSVKQYGSNSPPSSLRQYEPPKSGVLTLLPPSWVPYAELMRIEKPGGLYGFYFPYLIGLSYAASIASPLITPTHLLSTAGLLLVWNVILRGAACTINDNLDREYDRKVERCRLRPIARGAVSPFQGHVWYGALTVLSGGAVALLPNSLECFYHAVPILTLVSLYPLAKRVTDFPQVVLSIPLAWGILMSCSALGVDPYTAQSGTIAAATACLVTSNAIWIILLDYVNALQDSVEDVKAGVRSMAVRYQDTRAFIGTLGTAQVGLMLAAGWLGGLGPAYFVVSCGGNAAMLATMAASVKRSRPDLCAWWFLRGSILVGGTTVAGLLGEWGWRLANERGEEGREDLVEG